MSRASPDDQTAGLGCHVMDKGIHITIVLTVCPAGQAIADVHRDAARPGRQKRTAGSCECSAHAAVEYGTSAMKPSLRYALWVINACSGPYMPAGTAGLTWGPAGSTPWPQARGSCRAEQHRKVSCCVL